MVTDKPSSPTPQNVNRSEPPVPPGPISISPQEQVSQYLGNFIDLPAVTEEEVRQLQQTLRGLRFGNERTSIEAMPAFRAAEAKIFIGLYRAAMETFPDIVGCFNDESGQFFTPAEAQNRYAQWDANPDLPLVCTILAQDVAFAQRLSEITGRDSVLYRGLKQISIRGRVRNADGSWGTITTTRYHFGDEDAQVRNHAFISDNPLTQNRAHGVHEIPYGQDALYRNSFGLIHPIGNVFSRGSDGVIRGGRFHGNWVENESSIPMRSYALDRVNFIGSRLAEEIVR